MVAQVKPSSIDKEALKRAIKLARASDPLRDRQIGHMLKDRTWFEVATFAAYSRQCDTLNLKPWQPAPCWMGDQRPHDEFPNDGKEAAWELRRRLIAAGLSEYEPDPPSALAAIEARSPVA
jgi:hypothetical protein